MKRNRVDELVTKGLRNRYFRKATPKDVTFSEVRFHKRMSSYDKSNLELTISIGRHHETFNIYFRNGVSIKKWVNAHLSSINECLSLFNQTKDVKYLPQMVKILKGKIEDENWQMTKFFTIMEKITLNKMSDAMKFGLLTEEGYHFVLSLRDKYTQLTDEFNSLNNVYLENAKDLSVVERWSGGWDLKHALPSLGRSLGRTITFLNSLIKTNEKYYEISR